MTGLRFIKTVLVLFVLLVSSSAALGQQAVPDPSQWADLLYDAPSAPTSPSQSVPDGQSDGDDSDHTLTDLERIEREVRILLMPIIDESEARRATVGDAIANAASTIDDFLARYRDRITTDGANKGTTGDMEPSEPSVRQAVTLHPTEHSTTDHTAIVDYDLGQSRVIVSAAATELRRIAATLESAVKRGCGNK